MISIKNLSKTFTMHQQGGTKLSVLEQVNLAVEGGQCVVLTGRSGSGKSTLLRSLYGNYAPDEGSINIACNLDSHETSVVDLVTTDPRVIIYLRRCVIGWVSQFLRTMPRISTLNLVKQPALNVGVIEEEATRRAGALLTRLNIPQKLWDLAPATFSGGEQQRVNIARGFMVDYPLLLLDEPTASLDVQNRQVVINLIIEAKKRGAAIIGIFHDETARASVADSFYDISSKRLIVAK